MWLVILLLAIAGFQGLSILISRNQLKHFDGSMIQTIQGWESPVLTKITRMDLEIGSSSVTIPLIIVVAIVLFVVLKHRKELILLIGGMLGSTLLDETCETVVSPGSPRHSSYRAGTGLQLSERPFHGGLHVICNPDFHFMASYP